MNPDVLKAAFVRALEMGDAELARFMRDLPDAMLADVARQALRAQSNIVPHRQSSVGSVIDALMKPRPPRGGRSS